jgi:hypothetical protein
MRVSSSAPNFFTKRLDVFDDEAQIRGVLRSKTDTAMVNETFVQGS